MRNKRSPNFRIAGDNGHLLAVLRLAQIFEEGTFGFAQDREKSERYFRSAATLPDVDTSLHDLHKQSPKDGPIFIALMAKAFLIASESARYSAHAYAALKWFFCFDCSG